MHLRGKQWGTVMIAVLAVLFTLALVVYPEQGLAAAVSGLKVFWDVVLPSLLPFFILSEILLGLGVVSALGVLLEPLMRPLFSVPGVGAFALSMGLAAGYPMDAVITARFRRSGLCTRIEGERLLAFTNTADPLFMFGAVAVGMFKSPALGALLAVAHYASAVIVGLTFKLYGRREEARLQRGRADTVEPFLFRRAYRAMVNARAEDGRPFGKLLGDAVSDSIRTLLMIGGFIAFFSVFLRVLGQIGLVAVASVPLAALFAAMHMSTDLVSPFIAGLFEIDIGSAATAAASAPLVERLSVVSAIVAWSGLSVHAQVASVLTGTDIRMRPYFLARLYHALIAGVLTYILFHMGFGAGRSAYVPHAVSAMAPLFAGAAQHWEMAGMALSTWAIVLSGSLIVSIAVAVARRWRLAVWHVRS